MSLPAGNGALTLSAGVVTSQPDIRGLPDSTYASTLVHTLTGIATLSSAQGKAFTADLEWYGKWKDRQPREYASPLPPIWDGGSDASLWACGIGGRLVARLGKAVQLSTVQTLGRSLCRASDGWEVFQWDVPWANTSILEVDLMEDRIRTYLIGAVSSDLPWGHRTGKGYWGTDAGRGPPYATVDLKVQYQQPVANHRFLRQYDVYVLIDDLLDLGNWVSPMSRVTLALEEAIQKKPFAAHIGVRVHLRL